MQESNYYKRRGKHIQELRDKYGPIKVFRIGAATRILSQVDVFGHRGITIAKVAPDFWEDRPVVVCEFLYLGKVQDFYTGRKHDAFIPKRTLRNVSANYGYEDGETDAFDYLDEDEMSEEFAAEYCMRQEIEESREDTVSAFDVFSEAYEEDADAYYLSEWG